MVIPRFSPRLKPKTLFFRHHFRVLIRKPDTCSPWTEVRGFHPLGPFGQVFWGWASINFATSVAQDSRKERSSAFLKVSTK